MGGNLGTRENYRMGTYFEKKIRRSLIPILFNKVVGKLLVLIGRAKKGRQVGGIVPGLV